MGFAEMHAQRTREIKARLSGCADAKEAADRACQWVDEIRSECLRENGDEALRERTNALCAVAKAALIAMGAVNGARAEYRFAPQKKGWRDYLTYLPAALGGVLTAWLLFMGEGNAACAALLAAGTSVWVAREKTSVAPDARNLRAWPTVDGEELVRYLAYLFDEIDHLTVGAVSVRTAEAGELPRALLAPVQMLMEAQLTGDGDFALRSMPQLVDALQGQGLTIAMYTEENRLDFDLLPAQAGGETIRPALLMDGRLIARGQATVKE